MPSLDDLFLSAPRVVYGKNPLKNVVCQVRFPAVLRIEADPPVAFQEALRDHFPLFERTARPALPAVPRELLQAIGAPAGGAYIFRSETGAEALTLTSDALTLETAAYRQWGDFWKLAERAIAVLLKEYSPNYFVRAGLRYQNVITRSELGLADTKWSELLSPSIIGELTDPNWENLVFAANRAIHCRDDAGDTVLLQHGFGNIEGRNEQVYVIDFDFYLDKRIECDAISDAFKRFNGRSGRAFRWAITDKLYGSMGPDQN